MSSILAKYRFLTVSLTLGGVVLLLIATIVTAPLWKDILLPPDIGSQTNGFVLPTPSGYEQPTATPVFSPSRVIQACLDTPPIYPANLFHQAVNTIADWIQEDVASGQGTFIVFFGYVRGQSYGSTAFPPIVVPQIGRDEPQPTPIPPYVAQPGESPYSIADKQAAIDAKNKQADEKWQQQENTLHAERTLVVTEVKKQTDRLRQLSPVYDATASDQFGCLQTASQHFNAYHAENYLIEASAWVNNTTVNWTANLSLAHAHVRGIYTACPTAPLCNQRETTWKHLLLGGGAASDIAFYNTDDSSVLTPQF